MKITSIPQLYRNVNRWREILAVLSKYGLANWIGRLGPDFAKDLLKAPDGQAIARHSWETRVRLALSELGPTFIKLGQILSTRPDLIGVDLATELEHLQTDVPADPPEVARALVEKELGRPISEFFARFDDQPLASASIGQVHRAELLSGETVVVKIQRAGIERKVAVDLEILAGLALLAQRLPEFRNYRPRATVAEFHRTMRGELDFRREMRNMEEFARDFEGNSTIRIPHAYPELTTSRVLTMEFIEGVPISDTPRIRADGFDTKELARRGANIYLEMIFCNGLYHADPHPGNVVLLDGNVIGLFDFGMVGRMTERMQEDFVEMLMAVTSRDAEHLTSIITRVGSMPPGLDRVALGLDVADYISHYGSMNLEHFDLSGALAEMTEMIRRYEIMLPARVALLIKVLITLEGTAKLLNPNFNMLEVMKPYQKRLMLRQLSPGRQLRKLRRLYGEIGHLIEVLPRGIVDILQQVETGKFDVHLDHRGLEPSVNRLVLGMLASALFVGSALMLAHQIPPSFEQVPLIPKALRTLSIPGTVGCGLSIALGWRLWLAISRSGHLNRRED
ncbi:MAG: AarF/ABC1/UbiB kinase family protein [Pirellulales bacterium]|nr:AarF/ABC1/UbiB kinase family protein [Pirellulales bacterium]